jgi:hypothetical protein
LANPTGSGAKRTYVFDGGPVLPSLLNKNSHIFSPQKEREEKENLSKL